MNAGGVRAGLLFDQISGGEAARRGDIRRGLHRAAVRQQLVVKTVHRSADHDVLEQQFNNPARGIEPDHAAVRELHLRVEQHDDAKVSTAR